MPSQETELALLEQREVQLERRVENLERRVAALSDQIQVLRDEVHKIVWKWTGIISAVIFFGTVTGWIVTVATKWIR